jgi:hypothetical protein
MVAVVNGLAVVDRVRMVRVWVRQQLRGGRTVSEHEAAREYIDELSQTRATMEIEMPSGHLGRPNARLRVAGSRLTAVVQHPDGTISTITAES